MDSGLYNEEKRYFSTGELVDYKRNENHLILKYSRTKIALEFIKKGIVRVLKEKDEKLDFSSTYAVLDGNLDYNHYQILDKKEKLIVRTENLDIKISKDSFSLAFYEKNGDLIHKDANEAIKWNKNEVWAKKITNDKEKFYGLGEKTGFLNKKGKKYTMWNTDVFEAHIESTDPLYISIPFYLATDRDKSYGIYFDNSYKSFFDFRVNENGEYSFGAQGGKLDYYFIKGTNVKDVIRKYTKITGRMNLPPKWSLGYHQSRYSYGSTEEVKELANKFRENDIPCDVIHLDIHYMDDYRVFTWDENNFPKPEKLMNDLKEDGFKVVNIIDPGVKKDPDYEVYKEGMKNDHFCRYLDGELFTGDVWPEESVFPDFTSKKVRKWWADLHKDLLDSGVKGIWNDMNEPAVFNDTYTMDLEVMHENDGDPYLHKRFHNQYALLEAMGTYQGIKKYKEERPFVLSRAGFSGIQRYAATWTGDNRSIWDHLKLAVPMLMNMGISGLSFSGTDIGGFTGDSNGELLTRWTQLGTFMPFFRNHSSLYTKSQEPWAFAEKYEKIIKKFIELRYKFMPHIYNLFYKTSQKGIPVMRPLFMEFPDEQKAYEISYQFMVGDSILAAPVYEPKKDKKLIYLPEGNWVNYFSDKNYEGKQYIVEDTPLATMPLYIKNGSILVMGEKINYIGEKERNYLEIVNYLDENIPKNSYTLYEDDGISYNYQEGKYNLKKFSYKKSKEKIEFDINYKENNYKTDYKKYLIRLKNINFKPDKITFKGNKVKDWEYKLKENELTLKIKAEEGNIVIM